MEVALVELWDLLGNFECSFCILWGQSHKVCWAGFDYSLQKEINSSWRKRLGKACPSCGYYVTLLLLDTKFSAFSPLTSQEFDVIRRKAAASWQDEARWSGFVCDNIHGQLQKAAGRVHGGCLRAGQPGLSVTSKIASCDLLPWLCSFN